MTPAFLAARGIGIVGAPSCVGLRLALIPLPRLRLCGPRRKRPLSDRFEQFQVIYVATARIALLPRSTRIFRALCRTRTDDPFLTMEVQVSYRRRVRRSRVLERLSTRKNSKRAPWTPRSACHAGGRSDEDRGPWLRRYASGRVCAGARSGSRARLRGPTRSGRS
jgi:hypothetical protein